MEHLRATLKSKKWNCRRFQRKCDDDRQSLRGCVIIIGCFLFSTRLLWITIRGLSTMLFGWCGWKGGKGGPLEGLITVAWCNANHYPQTERLTSYLLMIYDGPDHTITMRDLIWSSLPPTFIPLATSPLRFLSSRSIGTLAWPETVIISNDYEKKTIIGWTQPREYRFEGLPLNKLILGFRIGG